MLAILLHRGGHQVVDLGRATQLGDLHLGQCPLAKQILHLARKQAWPRLALARGEPPPDVASVNPGAPDLLEGAVVRLPRRARRYIRALVKALPRWVGKVLLMVLTSLASGLLVQLILA